MFVHYDIITVSSSSWAWLVWAYLRVSAADGPAGASVLLAAGGHSQEHCSQHETGQQTSCAHLQETQVCGFISMLILVEINVTS